MKFKKKNPEYNNKKYRTYKTIKICIIIAWLIYSAINFYFIFMGYDGGFGTLEWIGVSIVLFIIVGVINRRIARYDDCLYKDISSIYFCEKCFKYIDKDNDDNFYYYVKNRYNKSETNKTTYYADVFVEVKCPHCGNIKNALAKKECMCGGDKYNSLTGITQEINSNMGKDVDRFEKEQFSAYFDILHSFVDGYRTNSGKTLDFKYHLKPSGYNNEGVIIDDESKSYKNNNYNDDDDEFYDDDDDDLEDYIDGEVYSNK